ncbi:MAG: hypothetical protein KOO62_03180 [candidate division Zixibacteria bacterium]|nr:hypothetical protein [candidate division Zixibacteria bacterium]
MKDHSTDRFDIIRQLALAASRGDRFEHLAEAALAQTSELVGLNAVALIFWDESFTPTLTVTHTVGEADKARLMELEKSLFDELRRDRNLTAAFLSFGGDVPRHSFTLPLVYHGRSFGAVIGLQEGERTIVSEEDFLQTLSALVALHHAAGTGAGDSETLKSRLEKERLSGILDTAVTVNHEINNPLQAILASVQLLMLGRKDIDDELKSKLKTIEEAAMKIGDVTQKLTRISNPNPVKYLDGTNMVDLNATDDSSSDRNTKSDD